MQNNLLSTRLFFSILKEAFFKLHPSTMIKNPVIFVTWMVAILTSLIFCLSLGAGRFSSFECQIVLWLWFTVLFANFSESLAEGKAKAHANSLKKNKADLWARRLDGKIEHKILATELKKNDIVVCEAGDLIPADGEVIEGIASIDESAITGESAPVIRESGGDRSAVTGGTQVISDRIVIRVSAEAGQSFLDHIIGLIEAGKRKKTPNEIALNLILSAFSVILLVAVVSLKFFADYSAQTANQDLSHIITVPVLATLLVCLIPTTIGALLSSIGIAGMDRLIRQNVIAKSGRAIEAAGDIDVLLIDKTGTITLGNRMASEFLAAPGVLERDLAYVAQIASIADETPEGRSIVVLAKEKFALRAEHLSLHDARFVSFSAHTRMSGVDITNPDGTQRCIRKGAVDAIKKSILEQGGHYPPDLDAVVRGISSQGGTPLAVADNNRVLGIVHLKDIVKKDIKERFEQLRKMGIRSVMITGDNPITAAAIAAEAGVDDFIAQATPQSKLERIREEQRAGHLVAMTGDGTNDAPALAQADVAVAMNTGTQAAREAGNLIDLDSNPTKVIEIVEIGKQLLITRGALTTFSIANDLAKYFALLPALFANLYARPGDLGPLAVLNIMHLHSAQSAILSAVIFNALIIMFLIPLALKGISYRAQSPSQLLSRNLLIYGLGGAVVPFLGIKLIDLGVVAMHLV